MRLNRNRSCIFFIIIIITGCSAGVITGIFLAITRDLPQIRSLETYRPSAVTRIYSSDNILLAELFAEKRDPVPIEDMPAFLKEALVATEDRNFYKHIGIDLKGILRAIIKDIMAGEFVEGASTIPQQLTKTLFLSPRKTLMRKIKEALLALQLERRYTKNEILELYLNQIYFGSGAYGVESAARIFFGKSVKELNLAESALIAGMPKAPSRYSPLINPELALKRRSIVLKQMLQTGIITTDAYQNAINEALPPPTASAESVKAPYFIEYIKKRLEQNPGASILYKGGLRIITTLSYDLQQSAEYAIERGLSALEERMTKNGFQEPVPQAALTALDVRTGGILAMVGGRDFHQSQFNRAVDAKRQPGSAFKPVVYALAIERGFRQNSLILDAPVSFKGAAGKDWEPKNFSKDYKGEITLLKALALSKNIPAVRLIEKLGVSSVVSFANSLGIQSPMPPDLSLALGTLETSLLDLTSVYAVFPNQGNAIKPYGIIEISDSRGRIIMKAKPKQHVVMSRAGAAIMTDMLRAVVTEGTGRKAKILSRPVGGKTGTTDKCKDALFIGFSPYVAAGVWVGRDRLLTLGKGETGAKAALPIWIDFMRKTMEGEHVQYFDMPDDVIKLNMDTVTGKIKTEPEPGTVSAVFRKKQLSPGKFQ
jgi:penicillin-binding protein 1A